MKKTIIFAALALLAQACVTYTDKGMDESPQRQSVEFLHNAVIQSVYVTIETADFFDRYQKIREDRDAAIALAKEYYGEKFNDSHLVYESFFGRQGGKILLTSVPGQYIMEPGSPYTYEDDTKYHVEVLEDRRYRITTEKPGTKSLPPIFTEFAVGLECIATVNPDYTVVVEKFDMDYSEEARLQITKATVRSTQDPVKYRLGENAWEMVPFSGTLDFTISGELVNDSFSVKYNNNDYQIL